MTILGKEIQLAIFDLDGTLIQSTSLWHEIDKAFFKARGKEVPEDYGHNVSRLSLPDAAKWTKDHYCPTENEEDILNEWKAMAVASYEHDIQLKEGAKQVLETFKRQHVKLALATACDKTCYIPCIARLGIGQYFEDIIDAHSLGLDKNSSAMFDELAARFNVHKKHIVVFEDNLKPLEASFNAGYLTIGIYDPFTNKGDESARKNCNLFLNRWEDLLPYFLY